MLLSANLELTPVDSERVFAFAGRGLGLCVIAPEDVLALTVASRPGTLDELTEVLSHHLAGMNDQVDVHARLQRLVEMGLIVHRDHFIDGALDDQAEATAHQRIEVIGVPTLGRRDALTRCLRSYSDNLQRHGRRATFLVVDDRDGYTAMPSGEPASPRIACPSSLSADRLLYVSASDRDACAKLVAEKVDLDPALVQKAIAPSPLPGLVQVGAARNFLLLLTSDVASVQVDDDTVCELLTWPGAEDGLHVTGDEDATNQRAYTCRSDAVSDVRATDACFLQVHEDLLGGRPLQVMRKYRQSGNLHTGAVTAELLERWQHRDARVLLSFCGIVGDAGVESPWPRLLRRRPDQSQFENPLEYERLRGSREIARIVTHSTLGRPVHSQTYAVGFAAHGHLAPFSPLGSGEDGLYSVLLVATRPSAAVAYLPFAIRHEPLVRPRFTDADITGDNMRVHVNDVLSALVAGFTAPRWGSPERSLRALGAELSALGTLSSSEFIESATIAVRKQLVSSSAVLHQRLRQFGGEPTWWANDLRRRISNLEATAECVNILDRLDEADRLGAGGPRGYVARFGDIVQAWPDMIRAARQMELRDRLTARRIPAAVAGS